MKRIIMITGIILLMIALVLLIFTSRVKDGPYHESHWFRLAIDRIDSIRTSLNVASGTAEAGFAKISLTPGINAPADNPEAGTFVQVPLAGYGGRKGEPSTGVHDSIFTRAAALKVGNNLVVFVTAGLLIMPPDVTDSVTARLAAYGLNRNQLFFSASHTHSGPGGWGQGWLAGQFSGKYNPNIEKWLVRQITEAVKTALADLQPAQIGSGSFKAGALTRNRLVGELGTKNDDFDFIVIRQTAGKTAVIGSFAAHSTTLGAGNMQFSSDYPGFWERKTEQNTGAMAMFFAGSMGSQSPSGEGKDFDRARFIGEALADSLALYLPEVILRDSVTLVPASLKVPLPEYHIRITPKTGLSTFLSSKLMPEPRNVYLQTARINNLVWTTTPADFSGEFALQIKNALEARGYQGMVTGFNGNYIGYVIPGKYFYLNEYEPKTMGWLGPYMGEYSMDLIRHLYTIVTNEGKKI